MALVLVQCPRTGHRISTGIEIRWRRGYQPINFSNVVPSTCHFRHNRAATRSSAPRWSRKI